MKLAKNLRLAPPPHLGLPQLPLGAAAVVQAQQTGAALSGVTGGRLIPQQHPVPGGGEDEQEVNYSGGGGASQAFRAGPAPLDSPGAEVLERPPDREAGAADPDRLQHAGVSELVEDQRLVELVGHLEAEGHMTVRRR